MNFRYDINGLRAIAVIAVVLFHFNSTWAPGGFAGVDVFFVISGFLMTRIIFIGLTNNNFNLFKFYVARANRIIPAIAVLCLLLLIFGWFYLTPLDYAALGKHAASSVGFISNSVYWRESGYFDAASHEKWLLHTWSLSVEWQFYIIYPIILIFLKNILSLDNLKRAIVIGTLLGFALSVIATMKWPNAAYYLLPTRAWEMMMGGIAFLYPWTLHEKKKKLFEITGLVLILVTYAYASNEIPWPSYYALLPVLGAYLVIVSNRPLSPITNNIIFQYLGKWSYSIYLWHWPIVVFGYYLELNDWWLYGIPLSLILGFFSFKFVESIRFDNYNNWLSIIKVKPIYIAFLTCFLSISIWGLNGIPNRVSQDLQKLYSLTAESPYRSKCHIKNYQPPEQSCEYFSENTKWAVFGDSQVVEISYALAEKLQQREEGVKHFSFSGCKPTNNPKDSHTKCARWYNESIDYIVNRKDIEYVVYNHRYSLFLLGDHTSSYPLVGLPKDDALEILESIEYTIRKFAKTKNKVYVYYPIPDLKKSIGSLVSNAWILGEQYLNLQGSTRKFYNERNHTIINFFKNTQYPDNVIFIEPAEEFCNEVNCFATLNGQALYFDDIHPSIIGAQLLIKPILENIPSP